MLDLLFTLTIALVAFQSIIWVIEIVMGGRTMRRAK